MMRGEQVTNSTTNNGTTTVRVASGVDRSGAVLVLGIGLLAVNFTFGTGAPVVAYLTGKTTVLPNRGLSGSYLLAMLAIFLLLLLSKTGEAGGNFAVLFLAAAWIVWLLNEPTAVARIFGQTASSGTATGAKTK